MLCRRQACSGLKVDANSRWRRQACITRGLGDSSSEVRLAAREALERLRQQCPERAATIQPPPRLAPRKEGVTPLLRTRLEAAVGGKATPVGGGGEGGTPPCTSPAIGVRESTPPEGDTQGYLYPGDPLGEAAVLPSAGPLDFA